MAVLASGRSLAGIGWATAAGALASLLYGVGANLVQPSGRIMAAALAAATLGAAALVALPFALLTWPTQAVPAISWWSALALGVLCTGAAYVLYYRLIARVGASRASTVTYLVPLFGVGWAWLLLAEPLTWPMAIAGSLILGSVAISQRRGG